MVARTLRTPPDLSPLPELRRDDTRILRIAVVCAVVLHVVALWLPLPVQAPDLPKPAEHGPIVVTALPIPPPPVKRPPARPAAASVRAVPLPAAEPTDEDLEPISQPVEIAPVDPPDWSGALPDLTAPVPPPTRPILLEGTEGLDPPVRLAGCPDPEYPAMGIAVRGEGRVILSAVIDEDGEVENVEVLGGPDPDYGFAAAAVEAVERWRYSPGTLHGRPVAVKLTVVVEFTLR